jgi:lipid-binding SYLF domain-containing protein
MMNSHNNKAGLFWARTCAGLLAVLFLLMCGRLPVFSQDTESERVEVSIQALREIIELPKPEERMPVWLLAKAEGLAIIPGVIKAAYGLGGEYGKGILMLRGQDGRWSDPCFIKLAGGSVGWQIGVQRADIVLVFKSRQSVQNITQGKFTLGADASITAGPVGRSAEASTDLELKAEIYSYSKSKGLFAGISIRGAALSIDDSANRAFYGREAVSAREILVRRDVKAPAVVRKLKDLLAEYVRQP